MVTVVALLAVLVMSYFKAQLFKGRDARRKSDIKRIQVAVEEYEKDHDCYPPPDLVTCDPGTGLTPYINKTPCDPLTSESYLYEPEDPSCPSWYMIYAKLENQKDADIISGIGLGGAYNYVAGSPNAPLPTPAATPTPTGGAGPTATPVPTPSGPPPDLWYGCKNGVCVPIAGRDECSPNYDSEGCFGQCGSPETECVPLEWQP